MALLLFALLCALNVADAWLTVRVLAQGGTEMNGFMRKAINTLGAWPALALIKATSLTIVWWAIVRGLADWPGQLWLMGLLCAVYAAIVFHNGRQWRQGAPNV